MEKLDSQRQNHQARWLPRLEKQRFQRWTEEGAPWQYESVVLKSRVQLAMWSWPQAKNKNQIARLGTVFPRIRQQTAAFQNGASIQCYRWVTKARWLGKLLFGQRGVRSLPLVVPASPQGLVMKEGGNAACQILSFLGYGGHPDLQSAP